MAKLSILAGATSQSVNVFIQDSSSTVGAGLSGLVYNSSGLAAYYSFAGANATATAITLATLSAVNSAFSSGGFKELDATHMKGVYRLDIPNAAIAASSGRSSVIYLYGATNMAPCVLEIELTGTDNQDATAGGISRLDAAVSSRMATYTQPTGFLAATFPSGTVANTTNITAGTITTVTTVTNQLTAAAIATGVWQDATSGDFTTSSSIGKSLYTSGNAPGAASGIALVGSNVGTASLTGDFTSTMKTSIGTAVAASAVASVTGSVGGDVTGKVLGNSASSFTAVGVQADLQTIKTQTVTCSGGVTVPAATLASTVNITAGTIATVTNLTNAATAGDFTSTMKTSIGTAVAASAVASVTGSVGGDVTGKVLGNSASSFTAVGVQADLQTIKTQTVTCGAGVTVGAYVGNATHALVVDSSGYVTIDSTSAAALVTAVWATSLPGAFDSGTGGSILGNLAAAADPWATELPGSYSPGQAGYIVGTNLDDPISGIGGAIGPGADACTMNIQDGSSNPIAQAQVWITTDSGGLDVVAGSLQTDDNGNVLFMLTATDTYYLWMRKSGYDPILGSLFVAVAD